MHFTLLYLLKAVVTCKTVEIKACDVFKILLGREHFYISLCLAVGLLYCHTLYTNRYTVHVAKYKNLIVTFTYIALLHPLHILQY